MKSFISEYGVAILAVVIVLILIMMISPIGTRINEAITGSVDSFTELGDTVIDDHDTSSVVGLQDQSSDPQNETKTFTIRTWEDTQYEIPSDYTWGDFLESEYNTTGMYLEESETENVYLVSFAPMGYATICHDDFIVYYNSQIRDGWIYDVYEMDIEYPIGIFKERTDQ